MNGCTVTNTCITLLLQTHGCHYCYKHMHATTVTNTWMSLGYKHMHGFIITNTSNNWLQTHWRDYSSKDMTKITATCKCKRLQLQIHALLTCYKHVKGHSRKHMTEIIWQRLWLSYHKKSITITGTCNYTYLREATVTNTRKKNYN